MACSWDLSIYVRSSRLEGDLFILGKQPPFHGRGTNPGFPVLASTVIPVSKTFDCRKWMIFYSKKATWIDYFKIERFVWVFIVR